MNKNFESIFKEIKLSKGANIQYLTEVTFKDIDTNSRIDGLVLTVSKGIIKDAVVKGYSSFGCFFEVNTPEGTLDTLCHLQEISYSRVNHPDEIFNIGEKHDLKIISIDMEKLQVGC